MNKCVWLLLGFIVFTIIVIYIIYLCNLHGRVSRLERRASPRLEIIEREIHGIGFYMRIIVGLAIFFCVSICIHYLIYCYPRYIPPQQTGFDYLGVIIAILALLVTLLVGWNIYSTIKAKEEIKDIKDDFDKQYGVKIKDLEDKVNGHRTETSNQIRDLMNDFAALTHLDQLIKDIQNGAFVPLEVNRTELIRRLQRVREQLAPTIENNN